MAQITPEEAVREAAEFNAAIGAGRSATIGGNTYTSQNGVPVMQGTAVGNSNTPLPPGTVGGSISDSQKPGGSDYVPGAGGLTIGKTGELKNGTILPYNKTKGSVENPYNSDELATLNLGNVSKQLTPTDQSSSTTGYTDPVTGIKYTSPEVAKQYGVNVGTASSGTSIQQQEAIANQALVPKPAVDPLKQGLEAAKASGAAPQDSAGGSAGVDKYTPPSPTVDPVKQAQTLLEQSPEYQQWTKDKKALDAEQSTTELSFIQQAMKDLGIQDINTKLLNDQKIIDGTEDDIRNEVTATGGFATDSQILGLTTARNKSLIARDKYLSQQKSDAMNMLTMMSSAFANDKAAAHQALMDKLNIDQQGLANRDKMISATQEGYKNVIQAVGYQGFVNSLLNTDPSGKTLASAEQMLGFGSGQLKSIATQEQSRKNLEIIQASGATSPYVVNSLGEVWNTQTGLAYSSAQDFQTKTGQTLQAAVAGGQIQRLPANIETQIKQAQLTTTQSNAKYADQTNQLDIAAKQASINASNTSSANSAYDLNYKKTHQGLTPSETKTNLKDLDKQGQSLLDDAAGYITQFGKGTLKWNDAWNALHTKYPDASVETLDNILQSQNYRK